MRERIKWTERRFDFNYPVGLYPEMIERLRGAPARMEDHCRSLPASVLTFRDEGRWSIQENAGHLLDLESLVQHRIDEYLANVAILRAADMSNRKTHEANYNEVTVESVLESFRRERNEIVERLESFDASIFARVSIHPRLNTKMRLVDLLFFTAEHDDYHLTRMSELRRELRRDLLLRPEIG
ncbi:MAG TPA: DinB family protein [Pyrinomonadaceae bacterium]|nr:DinB family protein [Pyrinomonadaceae bacterium]